MALKMSVEDKNKDKNEQPTAAEDFNILTVGDQVDQCKY